MKVWKFQIAVEDEFTLDMPEGAEPLYVAVQDDKPWLWALVTPGNKLESRTFHVHGTGHDVAPGTKYVGSFMLVGGRFVGHLFQG